MKAPRAARSSCAACLLGSALLVSPSVRAQGNDLSAPTGGRTALEANAGVALAQDGAAPFLNPATVVRIADERLAFSVNFFQFGITHASGWHQPGPTDAARFGPLALDQTGLTTSSFRVLPSSLCLFFTLGDLAGLVDRDVKENVTAPKKKIAICFASVESEDVASQALHFERITPLGSTSQIGSLTRRWSRTYVGPTYATQLTRALSVGGSLQGVYTYDAFNLDGSSLTSANGGSIASGLGTSGNGHSVELTANLGAAYKVGNTTFGASVQIPSLHVLGSYDGTFRSSDQGAGSSDAVVASASGDFHASPPIRLALGVGGEWGGGSLEFDASCTAPDDTAIHSTSDVQTTTTHGGPAATTNTRQTFAIANRVSCTGALGGERFVRKDFSVVGGVALNLSAIPPLHPDPTLGNLVQARMHHALLTAGIGSYGGGAKGAGEASPRTELLFGAQLDYGFGQALTIDPYTVPNMWVATSLRSYTAMFILAGATDLRTIKHAVDQVKGAVTKGDPDADVNKKGK